MKRILAIFLLPPLAFAYSANDGAKTITTDGSATDTQNAIDYADAKNQDGWVITVGTAGGSYTWTTQVKQASSYVHAVTIQSAGGDANKTTITLDLDNSGSGIELNATNNKLTRFTGFRILTGAGRSLVTGAIGFRTTGTGTAANSFRVDHCRFEDCANYAIGVLYPNVWNSGAAYGLIDHCDLVNTTSHNGMYFAAGTSTTSEADLGEWVGSMTWGTANTICVENCTFSLTGVGAYVEGNPSIDSAWFGVRWLARYCTFTNWPIVFHGADSAATSTLQVELYHDIFNFNINDGIDFVIYGRGGSARIYDITVNFSNGAFANSFLKTAIDEYTGSAATRALGFEQIGHGASAGSEVIVPVYVWGVTLNGGAPTLVGAPNDPNQQGHSTAGMFVQNTHYFLSAPGGFSELQYPHPLNTDLGSPGVAGGKAKVGGKTSIR